MRLKEISQKDCFKNVVFFFWQSQYICDQNCIMENSVVLGRVVMFNVETKFTH